jgi:hypothetical protein
MNVTIINIETNPVNEEADHYRIDIRFKCNDCGNEYLIGDDNEKSIEEFVQSLKDGLPNRYIGCPKCDLNTKSKLC